MIIYSVTVSIVRPIQEDWVHWMKHVHIPEVLATGLFTGHEFRQLVDPAPEDGTYTYNIQYTLKNRQDLDLYSSLHAPALQEAHTERYKDQFVAFRSILAVV